MEHLGPVVSGLAVAGVFALLAWAGKGEARRDTQTGDLITRMSSLYIWSMLLIGIGAPIFVAFITAEMADKGDYGDYLMFGMGAIFAVTGVGCAVWGHRRRTLVGDQGLTSQYLLAAPRFISWEEVAKLRCRYNQELLLITADGRKAVLHVWFVGVRDAVLLVDERLSPHVRHRYNGELGAFVRCLQA